MKILKSSIIPVVSLFSLALLSTAQAMAPQGVAVQEYAGSHNFVVNVGTIGLVTGTTAYGLRFSGSNSTVSDGNFVINRGTIISGTGYGYLGTAGILFDGSRNGQSNGNIVDNYGTIIGLSPDRGEYNGGIVFTCYSHGDTSNNLVKNYGSIQVSGSGVGMGIAFLSEIARSANNNSVLNEGTINVSTTGDQGAVGVVFDGQNGDSSHNVVINKGTIRVSAPQGEAYGIMLEGMDSGACNNNTVVNRGTIIVSGSQAAGIYVTAIDGTATNNVINNWGTITATNGAAAILIEQANNNVINLNGHSNITGLIAATGTNNVLNIALTGVSPTVKRELRAELGGALNGQPSSGAFVVRGVTYTYDPLIVTLNTSSYQEQARTPNQAAIGANLDSFKVNPTGDMLTLLNALDQSGNVPRSLEQLSPQRYQIYSDIALSNANFLTQGIDERLNNVRLGSESIDTSGLGVSSSSIQSKLGMSDTKTVQNCASMSKDGKSVTLKDTAPETKRWGAFLSGEATFANVDGRDWQQDSNFMSSGLLAGVDAKLTDCLTSGLLLSYAHTDADLDSQNGNANVDTYGAGVYTGYHEGNFYGNGLFTYSRNIYESDRGIDFSGISRSANGRTAGSQYVVNLDGGYDQPVTKDLTVGPYAGLQYVNLGVNSFTENGAGAANLAVNDQSVNSLRSRLGVRMELRKELTSLWAVASEVRLAWQHEFINNDRAIVAQFSDSGLGSFAVRTNDPERDAALIGLGLNATYRNTLTLFADYDVQAGQAHYTEQIVKGGFKWSF